MPGDPEAVRVARADCPGRRAGAEAGTRGGRSKRLTRRMDAEAARGTTTSGRPPRSSILISSGGTREGSLPCAELELDDRADPVGTGVALLRGSDLRREGRRVLAVGGWDLLVQDRAAERQGELPVGRVAVRVA